MSKGQLEILKQAYGNFYTENDDIFPEIHETGHEIKYSIDWDYPEIALVRNTIFKIFIFLGL